MQSLLLVILLLCCQTYLNNTLAVHPLTLAGLPHLFIDGAVQFHHIQHQLCVAATQEEY